MNAAVKEGGEVSYPQRRTPQGGVMSPLLSNIYLHEVLDVWFEHEGAATLPIRSREALTQVAGPAFGAQADDVGAIRRAAQDLFLTTSGSPAG